MIERLMYNKEYTPERITELKDNQVFVFGSNLAGSHGAGAARLAYERFGAVWGQGVGMQGRSYAIPTMQGGVETIRPYVDQFLEFAFTHPEYKFLVTRIGCGIAAFTPEEIAPLFAEALDWENVILPRDYVDVLERQDSASRSTTISWDPEADFLIPYRRLMPAVSAGDSVAYYQVKELRTKEFRNTVEIVGQGFYITPGGKRYEFPPDEGMMRGTAFYEYEVRVDGIPSGETPTEVQVVNITSSSSWSRIS